jgi:hypothetical protein
MGVLSSTFRFIINLFIYFLLFWSLSGVGRKSTTKCIIFNRIRSIFMPLQKADYYNMKFTGPLLSLQIHHGILENKEAGERLV